MSFFIADPEFLRQMHEDRLLELCRYTAARQPRSPERRWVRRGRDGRAG